MVIHTIRVLPGDEIHAIVHVSGNNVKVWLRNGTAKSPAFVKLHVMSGPVPDTSAADWIAEAPSNCDPNNRCNPLRLTDFGSVTFTGASATSVGNAGRHRGAIDDPRLPCVRSDPPAQQLLPRQFAGRRHVRPAEPARDRRSLLERRVPPRRSD